MKKMEPSPCRTVSRREFLKAVGATAAVAASVRGARARPGENARRPNLLVIVTDQQSASMLSCAGNPWLKTPAMDSLAATGTRFTRAFATNPVCLPSRVSFMTGLYPSAVGVRHNESQPDPSVAELPARAMGHLFRKAGYDTAYGGKIHLPGPMHIIGNCGFTDLTRDERAKLAERCAAYLREQAERQKASDDAAPFLLFASFINPHDICYMAIRDYDPSSGLARHTPPPLLQAATLPSGMTEDDFYARHCPPLPPNHGVPEGEPDGVRQLIELRKFRLHARETWTDRQWRLHRWAYCRLTERVDAQIGLVLAALRETGLDENTVVVLTSDHGDMDSAHKLEHKTVFYEEAVNIPFIVSWKGRTRAGAVDEAHLVSNGLDLIPTLCDYAGIPAPADLRGRSVRPLAEGKAPPAWRESVYVEDQVGHMVRTARFKYHLYDTGTPREMLTDLHADPGEMKNLAGDPAHADTLAAMQKLLVEQAGLNGVKLDLAGV